MARDPLLVLQALRRRSVAQAREALAACLSREAEAADRIRSLDDAARRDRAASADLEDIRLFLETLAIRRGVTQADRMRATATLGDAERRSEEARAGVAAARAASEAVEQLIDQRAIARIAEADRQEQHALDDIARLRRGDALAPTWSRRIGQAD